MSSYGDASRRGMSEVTVPVPAYPALPSYPGSPYITSSDDSAMVHLDVSSDFDHPSSGRRESKEQINSLPTFISLDMDNSTKEVVHAPPDVHKLYYLAACFFMTFAAFLPAQSLLTTAFSSKGFWGLFLMYAVFTGSTMYSTLAVKWLGVRKVLFLSSCMYVAFLGACIPSYMFRDTSPWIFFVACAAIGSVGGPFWVAQGVYVARLTQHSPSVIGQFNGTFLGIFFGCGVVGNLLTSIIGFVYDELPVLPIFYCMFAISVVACIMFIFIQEPPAPIQSDPSAKDLFRVMLALLKEKPLLFMLPYFFYVGLTVTFSWGKLPDLLPNKKLVPVAACVYSVGNLICSFVNGRVYDLYGWKPLAGFNIFIVIVASSSVAIAHETGQPWLFFLAAALLGAFEGLGNNLSLSSVMQIFPNQTGTALFYYRFTSGLGTALGFIVGYYVNYSWFLMGLGTLCGISLLLFAYYFMRIEPEERLAKAAQFTDDGS